MLVDRVEGLQRENEEERRRSEQLSEECLRLQSKLAWEQKEAELSRYQAVEDKRQKLEA